MDIPEEGTEFSLLDLSQITVEKQEDRVFLLAGEEKLDITQALERDGHYNTRRPVGTAK